METAIKVLEPSGIMDIIGGSQVRRDVAELIDSGIDIVLIDFKDISFMDSSGLGAMVATLQSVRRADKRLCFCSPNETVRMVLELTKLDKVFEIFDNRAAFDAAMSSHA